MAELFGHEIIWISKFECHYDNFYQLQIAEYYGHLKKQLNLLKYNAYNRNALRRLEYRCIAAIGFWMKNSNFYRTIQHSNLLLIMKEFSYLSDFLRKFSNQLSNCIGYFSFVCKFAYLFFYISWGNCVLLLGLIFQNHYYCHHIRSQPGNFCSRVESCK